MRFSVSFRPAWSTRAKQLHRKTLSQKTKTKNKKQKTKNKKKKQNHPKNKTKQKNQQGEKEIIFNSYVHPTLYLSSIM